MTWDEQNYTNKPGQVRGEFLYKCKNSLVFLMSLGSPSAEEPPLPPKKSCKVQALEKKVAKLRTHQGKCLHRPDGVPEAVTCNLAKAEAEMKAAEAEAEAKFETVKAKFEEARTRRSLMCVKATELLKAHGSRYEELLESLTRIHKGQPKVSWGPVTPEIKAQLEAAHAAAMELESLRLEFEEVRQM